MYLSWISLIACFPRLSLTGGQGPCLCVVTIMSPCLAQGPGTSVHPANPCQVGTDPAGTTGLPTARLSCPQLLPLPKARNPLSALAAVVTLHWGSQPLAPAAFHSLNSGSRQEERPETGVPEAALVLAHGVTLLLRCSLFLSCKRGQSPHVSNLFTGHWDGQEVRHIPPTPNA